MDETEKAKILQMIFSDTLKNYPDDSIEAMALLFDRGGDYDCGEDQVILNALSILVEELREHYHDETDSLGVPPLVLMQALAAAYILGQESQKLVLT